MEQLQQFYAAQKEELRPVIFAARAIDLHELFVAVQARGGFSMVCHISVGTHKATTITHRR